MLPRIRSLLRESGAQVVPAATQYPASDVEPIWRVRLQTSGLTGSRIDGLSELVDRLQTLPANTPIDQFGIVGATEAGNVFFDATSGEVVGVLAVVMSEHTRAYFRGELKGRPFDSRGKRKRFSPISSAHPESKTDKVKARKAVA